jgi:hypothetical protein
VAEDPKRNPDEARAKPNDWYRCAHSMSKTHLVGKAEEGIIKRSALQRIHRILPAALGAITLAAVGLLVVADLVPTLLTRQNHDRLGAMPLALIAIAYLLHQTVLRPAPKEVLKAVLVAIAFLSWSANQVWPMPFAAMVFNDIAIGLFVLDVFLGIIGWPPTLRAEAVIKTSSKLAPRDKVDALRDSD